MWLVDNWEVGKEALGLRQYILYVYVYVKEFLSTSVRGKDGRCRNELDGLTIAGSVRLASYRLRPQSQYARWRLAILRLRCCARRTFGSFVWSPAWDEMVLSVRDQEFVNRLWVWDSQKFTKSAVRCNYSNSPIWWLLNFVKIRYSCTISVSKHCLALNLLSRISSLPI